METKRIRITSATRKMSKAEEVGHTVIAVANIADTLTSMVEDKVFRHREVRDKYEERAHVLGWDDSKDLKKLKQITRYVMRNYGDTSEERINKMIKVKYDFYKKQKA